MTANQTRTRIIDLAHALGMVAAFPQNGDAEVRDRKRETFGGTEEAVVGWLESAAHEQITALRALLTEGIPAPADAEPDSWVGRVYDDGRGIVIFIECTSDNPKFVIGVDQGGFRASYLKSELEHWTLAPYHPLATDKPRDDGLGWREGDEYHLTGDYIYKERDGKYIARTPRALGPLVRDGNHGTRLTSTPSWEAMADAPSFDASLAPDEKDAAALLLLAGDKRVAVVATLMNGARSATASWQHGDNIAYVIEYGRSENNATVYQRATSGGAWQRVPNEPREWDVPMGKLRIRGRAIEFKHRGDPAWRVISSTQQVDVQELIAALEDAADKAAK